MTKKVYTNLDATGRTITAATFSGDLSGTIGGNTYSSSGSGVTFTLPSTTATIARTDSAQTFAGNQTFSGQVIANGNIGPNGTNPLTIYTLNQSSTTVSTNIIMRSGNQTGTAVSGNVTVTTGATSGAGSGAMTIGSGAATSGASGGISILSGTTTTSGNSGTVSINVGTAAGTAGSINIGTAAVSNSVAPTAINIGASGTSITLTGTVTNIGSTIQAYDADLDAIAALSGTSGVLKKTAANTWSLDTAIPSMFLHTPVSNYTIGTTTVANTTISGSAFAVTPTLAASTTYLLDSILYVQSVVGSGTGTNLQLQWTTGSGSTGNIQLMTNAGLASLTTSSTTTTSLEVTNFSTVTAIASPAGTQVTKIVIKGIVRTGATSPAIYPVWAMTNSSTPGVPTSLTTLVGSYYQLTALSASGSNVSIGTWA